MPGGKCHKTFQGGPIRSTLLSLQSLSEEGKSVSMNQAVETLVSRNQVALKSLCNAQKVRELGLFGSAVTDAFDLQRSDLDFVVEFDNADQPGIADRFMNLASGLEAIFHRKVDLITNRSLKNPIFKKFYHFCCQS